MIKEFECVKCGKIEEVWDRFDSIPDKCEYCGGDMKKIISKNNFHLKGTGWASTRYSKEETKKSKKK